METIKEKEEKVSGMQAMMEQYAKLAQPGAPHQLLAKFEGSWVTSSRSWMGPDQPPMVSSGACENRMIYGGRFLHMEYTDTMMDQPVAGLVIMGYDNNTKKYVTTSLSSMGTGIYLFEGPESADGKTIIQESRYNEPVMGTMTYRAVTKMVDGNKFTFEMFGIDKNGTETKMMETVYTRK